MYVLYFIRLQICKNYCFVSNTFFWWGVLFVLFIFSLEKKNDQIKKITHGFFLIAVSTLEIYALTFGSLDPRDAPQCNHSMVQLQSWISCYGFNYFEFVDKDII